MSLSILDSGPLLVFRYWEPRGGGRCKRDGPLMVDCLRITSTNRFLDLLTLFTELFFPFSPGPSLVVSYSEMADRQLPCFCHARDVHIQIYPASVALVALLFELRRIYGVTNTRCSRRCCAQPTGIARNPCEKQSLTSAICSRWYSKDLRTAQLLRKAPMELCF